MTAARRSTALSTVITVMAVLGMTGCQDEIPTDPTVTGIALKPGGGGGKGPKVESTDPTSAPQDTTLDVQVFGSSFDEGSWVTLTIDGTTSDLVETDTTTFVSDKQLIARITIDLNAIVELYDVEVLSSRGRKGIGADLFSVTKKGKPVEESNYTITDDLGTEGSVSDINDAGVIVGSAPSGGVNRAARWIKTDGPDGGQYSSPELLGDGVWESGPGSWASAVNASNDAVGVVRIDANYTDRGALWSGGGVDTLPLLDIPLPDTAHEVGQAYDINDAGQISGQSRTPSGHPALAVRWEPDGFGGFSATDLGVLPGYESSIGWAINNLGWVGGTSRPADGSYPEKRQHAVLWIDDGSGQISAPLDLHPGQDIYSRARGISDVTTDGKVYVAGYLDGHPAVWVVDVAPPHGVMEHVLEEVFGGAVAVNAAGEVVVSGPAVWTREGGVDLVDPLPQLLSKRSCYSNGSSGRAINKVGTVVGSSGVFAKGQCVQHAVVWTKINNN